MDGKKKARTPLRSQLTKAINSAERELAKDEPCLRTLKTKLETINDLEQRLTTLDDDIIGLLYVEQNNVEEYNKEVFDVEDIREKIREIQSSINEKLVVVGSRDEHLVLPPSPSSVSSFGTANSVTGRRRTYKLPKVEIRKFSGEVLDWLPWWNQFERIHEDDELHAADKFQYLTQSMKDKSKAAELLSRYPQSAANYPHAVKAFQERFGKPKILKRVYVRELLNMINQNVREFNKISTIYDRLEAHLKALESLGVTPDQMDVILFPMVESCLPEDILMAWQRSQNYGREDNKANPPKTEFDYLLDFVKQEVENENQREMAKSGFSQNKQRNMQMKPHQNRRDLATASSLSNTNGSRCIFCDRSNHKSEDCYKANTMTMDARREAIKRRNACLKCLKRGHLARLCREKVTCTHCKASHSSILCRGGLETTKEDATLHNEVTQTRSTPASTNSNSNQINLGSRVLLKTVHVNLKDRNGKTKEVRLLFDDGSERSYIKKSTIKEMGYQPIQNFKLQNNLFGGMTTDPKPHRCYRVQLEGIHNKRIEEFTLIDEDVIVARCPAIPNGPWIQELTRENIRLTDTWAKSPELDILIGSDLWGYCITGQKKALRSGLYAFESIFGWSLCGEIPTRRTSTATSLISMTIMSEKSIQDLWSLEAIGIRDKAETISREEHDEQVKKSLQQSMSRDPEGRYTVRLPWINEETIIPTNRKVAESRLIRATEKLNREQHFKTYDQIFRDWEKEGIIQVDVNSEDSGHFLPHRPVFKPESLTTPVRPVFDASCKTGKNPSLNQCLEKGPNMLELIPSILLRFRQKKIGVIADIRKAFQMVGVAENDRNYQKFLWWEDSSQTKFKIYKHCRVVFGLNCSPFILAAVLNFHMDQVPIEDKPVADLLKKSIYVDNVVTSMETSEELEEFKSKSIAMLADAKMELRCWESSSSSLRELEETNVLGLRWEKNTDTISCQVPDMETDESPVTKRKVLSAVSQIFDPIGFTCPATLQPKLLLQDSWAVSMDWDKPWEETESQKFRRWVDELPELKEVKIPRHFGNSRNSIQLHQFCDASQSAYASAIFARVEEDGNVKIQLVLAKSRLAPLDKKKKKAITIPRLELMGCLIGVRLMQTVKEALDMEDVSTFHWSDSTIALAWIKRDEDWGTFVGNRVREINRSSRPSQWRHVPGNLNPADLPSRGCSPSELLESRWWEGPSWLLEGEDKWPQQQLKVDEELVNQERRKCFITSTVTRKWAPRFSSYMANLRVHGWIRRFIFNCKRKPEKRYTDKYLNLEELCAAEVDLLKEVQERNGSSLQHVKKLQLTKDENNLIYVKSRLSSLEDTVLFKSPMLLPKEDPIVHQLIQFVHESHGHAGTQFVLGKLREKYWILQGRKTVSRIINKCVVCRRHSGKNLNCVPADLPKGRIQAQYAFETTGVDLAGPLLLKGGKKMWIVIYTCAVYRGVYLDTVSSLSTEDFIDSLEKFTLIIGRPSTIYSDNGTNFVGAENIFKKIDQRKLQVSKIIWKFNPPSAAWWGGWWERLVRSLKELLRRMIGTAKLMEKELHKCLASISYTINNRPLTTLTEDPEDLRPLTPAMFMRDLPIGGLPETDRIDVNYLRDSYQKMMELKRSLNNRFRKEYLSQLVQRKNELKISPPRVGDVVLVGADNRKRFEWPLGKITELYPGKDNHVRVAKVKTVNGYLIRPLQRLYPLEVSNHEDINVLVEIKEKAGESSDERSNVDEPADPQMKTRYGRQVRAPDRYSAWNR